MHRRQFHQRIAAAFLLAAPAWPARARAADAEARGAEAWAAIEASAGGRLGVAVMQAGGAVTGRRLDERFPLCSTFKWLAAAQVLHRVDRGQETLARRLPVAAADLRPNSPVSERHVGSSLTLAELCEATVTRSDNTAANLILATLGGPAGLTAYARSLGDPATRLDGYETDLNEAPGDPRDTTTPRAMAGLLGRGVLGDALSVPSRARLRQWLEASKTDGRRLRAGLPAGWRLGSKTGTGNAGSTHDVGIFWPPGRPPIVVAAYLSESPASEAERNAAIAAVARTVTSAGPR